FEASAVFPRAREGTQHLGPEIAVAGFDIDKSKADTLRNPCGAHVILDQTRDVVVTDDDRVIAGIDAEFRIEDRVVVGDFRFKPFLVVGTTESPRMSQLQSDEKIVNSSYRRAVRLQTGIKKDARASFSALDIVIDDTDLVRVGSAVALDCK